MAYLFAATLGIFDVQRDHWTRSTAKSSVDHLEWLVTDLLAKSDRHFGKLEIDNRRYATKWRNTYVGDSVVVIFVKNDTKYSMSDYPWLGDAPSEVFVEEVSSGLLSTYATLIVEARAVHEPYIQNFERDLQTAIQSISTSERTNLAQLLP